MSISALDSRVFRDLFGTSEIRAIFSDEAYVLRMIEVEAVLARAQSLEGVIPTEAGESISTHLSSAKIDFERLSRETEIVGYPVLPLVRQLIEQTPAEQGKYIHWGATTQDIMDNASVLQMRQGIGIVQSYLDDLISILQRLARAHRDTPIAGRTHLQHALPSTFGYKCAVYLSSILRHSERLLQLKARCFLAQFGGAAGTLASLGSDDKGMKVRARLAVELNLSDPPITWHAARDNVAEIINFLALVGGSLGKIAYDLIVMSSNELGEVAEPFVPHRGASSTMPQKRNPVSSEIVFAASKLLRANAGLVLDAMVVDFERASGPWHLEWIAIPEAFVLAVGSLHQTTFALRGLVVNADAMRANLALSKGLIVGEAVMMGLAPFIGRQQAHDVVYEACKTSVESQLSLFEVLKGMANITGLVDEEQLKRLCDPIHYLGASGLMVDSMIERERPR